MHICTTHTDASEKGRARNVYRSLLATVHMVLRYYGLVKDGGNFSKKVRYKSDVHFGTPEDKERLKHCLAASFSGREPMYG